MYRNIIYTLILAVLAVSCTQNSSVISFDKYGVTPDSKENASPMAKMMVDELKARANNDPVTVVFPKGRYDFYEEDAFEREYYISNHDQVNPKKIGFALEELENVTIDGQGSEFIFHGRMVPFALLKGKNIKLKNISIDFELPAFRQLEITEVDRENNELLAKIYPEGNYRIENGKLIVLGEGYEATPTSSMPFRADKRLSYNRADISFNPEEVSEEAPNLLRLKGWYQTSVTEVGERYALRAWYRPTPGIFISECTDTYLENVTVHYAEGMALLAQMSENITLDGFSVALRGENDPRYFTAQADATHFSGCKGVIISKNGLYEGMADDAINVHGTYLRVVKRVDNNTLHARYMHSQAWGFKWGEVGDTVQFVESSKMELVGNHLNTITSIKAIDKSTEFGAKEFEITFADALPEEISEEGKYGVENLTWTPEVIFSNNIIRNNRARGALFSTPKRVVCEDNTFDHTHGTAILLCGDCNGWYETGACKEVIIRNNKFINSLTAQYQFTNAIISIYPEIPNLEGQEKFFHSGIVIEGNTFETFDRPLLYAKSTNGLIFRNNKIISNNDFDPFHWNTHAFLLEKVDNVVIENNNFDKGFDAKQDIMLKLSDEDAVTVK